MDIELSSQPINVEVATSVIDVAVSTVAPIEVAITKQVIDVAIETSVIDVVFASGVKGKAGRGITDAAITYGHLVFTYNQDPTTQDVGQVVGDTGNGIDSITQPTPTTLLVTYTDGGTATFTLPSGVGIASLEIVGVDLVVTYTDSTTANLGRVVGYNGTNGTNGTNGQDGRGNQNGLLLFLCCDDISDNR